MAKILGFTIWYSDHTVQGKTYADWEKCQSDDVQVVLIYENKLAHLANHYLYRLIGHSSKFYGLTPELDYFEGDDKSEVKGSIKTGASREMPELIPIAMADHGYGFVLPPRGRGNKAGQ